MQQALTHRFAVAVLAISAVIAAAMALATDADGRALWLLLWGGLAYAAAVAIVSAMAPRVESGATIETIASSDSADPLDNATEEALRHLHDHGALAESHLLRSLPNTLRTAHGGPAGREATPLEQAQVLHEVILSAIQKLRPPGDERDSRSALEYRVLHEEYVLQRPNSAIMTSLSMSERTFFRYRRAAIAAIARDLQRQERILANETSTTRQ